MRRLYASILVFAGILLGLCILLLSIPKEIASQVSQEQMDKIEQGIKHATGRRYGKAESLFKEALVQEPEDSALRAIAYNNLANTYLLQGKYASAIDNYHKALRYGQTDYSIYLNLGIVYHLQMEVTKDKPDVDSKPIKAAKKATKNDWEYCSKEAFKEAIERLGGAEDARNKLLIPTGKAEYSWLLELLDKAAIEADKDRLLHEIMGTAGKEKAVRVYWKEE